MRTDFSSLYAVTDEKFEKKNFDKEVLKKNIEFQEVSCQNELFFPKDFWLDLVDSQKGSGLKPFHYLKIQSLSGSQLYQKP